MKKVNISFNGNFNKFRKHISVLLKKQYPDYIIVNEISTGPKRGGFAVELTLKRKMAAAA